MLPEAPRTVVRRERLSSYIIDNAGVPAAIDAVGG